VKAVRERTCTPLSKAKISIARRELVLLGVAVMNNWSLAESRFSLTALRAGAVADENPTPDFTHWCLRNAANRRAAAIFIELQDGESVDAVAAEHGLAVHPCPADPRWVVLMRVGEKLIWPRAAREVRRNR
jgi:hypothetical protein